MHISVSGSEFRVILSGSIDSEAIMTNHYIFRTFRVKNGTKTSLQKENNRYEVRTNSGYIRVDLTHIAIIHL